MARKFKPGYDFRSSDFRSQPDRQQHVHSASAPPPLLAVAFPPIPATDQAAAVPQPAKGVKPVPAPADACPGDCNKPHHKAWREYAEACAGYDPLDADTSRPEPPTTNYWPGEPAWCPGCTTKIRLRLAQLDTLAGILSAEADGHRTAAEAERVSGTADPSSPSRAADDLDEMFGMLSTWETIYRDLKGWLSGPPRGELASRETECIDWLRRQLKGILVSDIARDFGLEILQWHRESCGSAKAGVRTLRKPMRCPSCKNVTLFWTEGERDVHCKNPDCNRIMSLSAYEDEAERQAAILARGEDLDAELEAS